MKKMDMNDFFEDDEIITDIKHEIVWTCEEDVIQSLKNFQGSYTMTRIMFTARNIDVEISRTSIDDIFMIYKDGIFFDHSRDWEGVLTSLKLIFSLITKK